MSETEEFGDDPELRAMLYDLDPMSARVPVEPPTSPRARHLLEQVMSQGIEINESTTAKRSFRGKTWLAAAAAIAAVAVGTTVAVTATGGDSGKTPVVAAPVVMNLQAGASDAMAMCMMFDVNQLKTAGVAFGGTVTKIGADTVTLDVDRWFKGEPKADEVTVTVPPGGDNVALDGVAFEQGKRFLISATDGVVGTCGYSGPATPEFEKYFEQAFPAS